MQDLNRDKWLLMDEKQHLEYKFLFDGTKLSKVSHPENKKHNIGKQCILSLLLCYIPC